MRILIHGGGFENRGAEAMLRSVQRELGRRLPGAAFHALLAGAQTTLAHTNGIECRRRVITPFQRIIPGRLGRIAGAAAACVRHPALLPVARLSLQSVCDATSLGGVGAVIDVSGYKYGDAWPSPGNYRATLAWIRVCQTLGKPYIFLPQAWGPFNNSDVAARTRELCAAGALLYARDGESLRHLQTLLPGADARIKLSPDIAFRFQGAPPAAGRALLANLGVEPGQPLIGIAPNMRVYERIKGEGAGNPYVQTLIRIADHCIDHLGASVVLVPNEVKAPGITARDDRFLCGLIRAGVRDANRCVVLLDRHSTDVVKALLGQLDLLLGSRFHSLVLSLSSGVPVVAVGWSHKYGELLKPFGLSDYVMEHQGLEADTLLQMVDRAWSERETLKTHVRTALEPVHQAVDTMFDEVADVIRAAN